METTEFLDLADHHHHGISAVLSRSLGSYHVSMARNLATPETLAARELIASRRNEFEALLKKYSAYNPQLFGSVARGTAGPHSDIDILVEMDPSDGNLLLRTSGLMEETRELFGRDDVDIFPVQLLRRPISESAVTVAIAL